jgi:hypothetical protein
MPRLARTSVSLAIMLVAYWAYALLAVPLIEPQVERRRDGGDARDRQIAQRDNEQRIRELEGLFPADGWDLARAKILESDQLKLLIWDYKKLTPSKVEIRPCAIVYMPEGQTGNAAERRRQAVVLESRDGAVLEFDQPFDLSRGKIGRLTKGRLEGRIVIRSDSKQPGPQDDLLIVTRDVAITEQFVFTPHEVEFRYGANHGRGRQLSVKLLPGDPAANFQQHGPNVGGIEQFAIEQLDKLHLDFGGPVALPNQPAAAPGQAPEMAGPIEVSCQGPFCFSPEHQTITLENQVDVLRLLPNGPSDQLSCERLVLHLARPRDAVADPAAAKKMAVALDLQPRRIEAFGNPVVLRSPSQKVEARGEHLEYHLERQRFALKGKLQEVVLHQEANEIHARSVEYQAAERGGLGQVFAQGPGWLRAKTDRFPQPVGARWNGHLKISPDEEQRQVIRLIDGAELAYGSMGSLAAGQIFFWLFEAPPGTPPGQPQFRPDRMLAQQNVRLNSPQLSGAVHQMEVWFAPPAPVPQRAEAEQPEEVRLLADGLGRLRALIPTAWKMAWRYPAVAQALQRQMVSAAPVGGQVSETGPARHFNVTGDLLRCQVVMQGEEPELADLLIDGNVRFQETPTERPDSQPIRIEGDQLHIVDASKPHAAVTITGARAHFEGPRIGLTGTNINLNRGANRMWIDGAGRMDLTVDRDLQGQALAKPSVLQIDWQRQMTFDGRIVHFEESVVAATPDQQLRTEILDVTLKQMIRFDSFDGKQPVEPEKLLCAGGVKMESQAFDPQGLSMRAKMQMDDLVVNLDSGDLRAKGPGQVTSVSRQSGSPLGEAAGMPPPEPAESGSPGEDQLIYLNVRFQGGIVGNLHRREMAFHDYVKTAYAQVATWDTAPDPDNPDALGPQGFVMNCDRMQLVDLPMPQGAHAIQLDASGSTVVEGQMFTARAVRITYDKSKDLLILYGDGRTSAELSVQKYVGGPVSTVAARQVRYYPTTRRLRIDGGRWLELNELPSLNAPSK